MSDVLFPRLSTADDATGVIVSWFVDTGDEVTPKTLIAEVAVDKVDAEVYPEIAGTITLLVEEEAEVPLGSIIASVTPNR
ncbi:lipoyl domain-containing protein [Arthrobacter alkaliphilus]|uniref:lipoyl domain-containing protein n=1 Tax=Arthrobacter alkaliphilus TaxID=369936 RepID=UPI001F279763|nr:biotin/lipoyl-containing protein [Arthrobacter alkaliphilus]